MQCVDKIFFFCITVIENLDLGD